mmetsp:Transcript_39071/g.94496  ORF Transcript_39071/g.94496 Transcript_39071/m.94496 type:complete len:454 (-) Transcript_39071:191-1552(-)
MSLLGSIFGGGASSSSTNANDANDDSLFQKSKTLPDRPQHKAVPISNKKKKKLDEGKNGDKNNVEDGALVDGPKKKKRKTRKPEKTTVDGDDEDGTSPSASNDDDDNGTGGASSPSVEDRTVFVGGLPLATTTRKTLQALFKDCGPIESTRIRNVPVTGIKLPQSQAGNQNMVKKVCVNLRQIDHDTAKSTVQGYVVFKDVQSVEKALLKNNTIIREDDPSGGGGHDGTTTTKKKKSTKGDKMIRLRVDRSTPSIDPARSVFCGGLPYGAEETSLHDHFVRGCDLQPDDVLNVRIVRDKETHRCKGFGYVLFKDKAMVATALNLRDSTYMNKPLRVLVCGKRFKGKKGANTTNFTLSPSKKKGAVVPGTAAANEEKVSVGAFRRIIAKQKMDAADINRRKRGGKKNNKAANSTSSSSSSGLSRRAALEKKVDKKVKKLQKRASKGMGKMRKGA